MSDRDSRPARVADKEDQDRDEPFLRRWARLKKESREPSPGEVADPAHPLVEKEHEEAQEGHAAKASAEQPEVEPLQLPSLDSLTAESDFGPFMKPGVDPALRRLALRKMWSNPKYGIVDPLDPYKSDYQAFTALGDTITSDMKYHAERFLREQLDKAADAAGETDVEPGDSEIREVRDAVLDRRAAGTGPESARDSERADDEVEHGPTEDADERRDA